MIFAISLSLSASSSSLEFIGDLLQPARRVAEEGGKGRKDPTGVFEAPNRTEVFRDPSAHDRFGGRPHVELRIELSCHALDDDHCFLEHHQFDSGGHFEQGSNFEQERQDFRHRDLIGGAGVDRFADSPESLGEIFDPICVRHVAGLEMNLGNPQVVAANETVEDFSQESTLLAPQPTHDPKIHGDDMTFLVDEKIALMHIGVEEAVAQRCAQKCLNQSAGKGLRIKPKRDQTVRVGQGHPVDPFHRHHLAGGAAPVHHRRANVWIIL